MRMTNIHNGTTSGGGSIGDGDAALGEKVFYFTEAEAETVVAGCVVFH